MEYGLYRSTVVAWWVGFIVDCCSEGIYGSKVKGGEYALQSMCYDIERVKDSPWNVPWLGCSEYEVCSCDQCHLLVKG